MKVTFLMLSLLLLVNTPVKSESQMVTEHSLAKRNGFLGQRPYMDQSVGVQAEKPDTPWEGTAMVLEPSEQAKTSEQHKQLRLHFIGKRAYTPY